MNAVTWLRVARGYAFAVGAMDFLTGLGLVTMPELTLGLMQAEAPGEEAWVFVRFLGAFVGAVGASYLWAARSGSGSLRTTLIVTLFFRGSAGTFAAGAVLTGHLGLVWLGVAVTDLGCVAAQLWWLRRGADGDA